MKLTRQRKPRSKWDGKTCVGCSTGPAVLNKRCWSCNYAEERAAPARRERIRAAQLGILLSVALLTFYVGLVFMEPEIAKWFEATFHIPAAIGFAVPLVLSAFSHRIVDVVAKRWRKRQGQVEWGSGP